MRVRTVLSILFLWALIGSALHADSPPVRPKRFAITDEDRSYWAFQPVPRVKPPAGKGHTPIDAFVEARILANGLVSNDRASARARYRRLAFDLLGLPPSPDEVNRFTTDASPQAWDRLTDRLLASPSFGERWAQHWLDLVRYAETNGYERDGLKPHVWRYRDYVVNALNKDLPYKAFIQDQLAGDLSNETSSWIATGFYRLHVWDDEPDNALMADYDELHDILSTTCETFVGLTIGCARCHDHKFDPFSQKDYYQLLAHIHNIELYGRPHQGGGGRPLGEITRIAPSGEEILAIKDTTGQPRTTRILKRGDPETPGEAVIPGSPVIFSWPSPPQTHPRKSLADWITHPDNPLTARVLVNRLWQHLFGVGLVATPNDFGKTGLPPSHPELLDYLASRFIHEDDWHLKRTLKQLLLTDAYQRSSDATNRSAERDPENRLFWRQHLRRIEGEALRDGLLAFAGTLNHQMGGPSMFPDLSPEVHATQDGSMKGWGESPLDQQNRRSLYIHAKRALPHPFLSAFDADLCSFSLGKRPVTTVAPQALMLLNDPFVTAQSSAFIDRLTHEVGEEVDARMDRAFALVLQRPPTSPERDQCLNLLASQPVTIAWRQLAAALFNLSETLYLD